MKFKIGQKVQILNFDGRADSPRNGQVVTILAIKSDLDCPYRVILDGSHDFPLMEKELTAYKSLRRVLEV